MLIGSLLSPTATSVYSSTGRALQIGSNLPMALIESAGPGLAELRAVSQERVRVAARTLLCLVPVTTGLFLVGYVAANPAFVNWWLGPSQFGGRLLTVVIAVSIGCKHYLAILTYAIFYLGKERRPLVISLVTTPLATLVLLLGARELGPIAAPLGVVIATLCVGAPMGLASLAKDLGPEMPALLKHLMAWAWRFVVAMTAAYFLSVWLDGGLMASIAAALLAGAVYVVLVAPLVLSGTMGEYLLARLPRAIERPLSLVRLLLDRWSGRSRLF
jgi:O-antigen/teichoic acid export membrane protein